MLAKRIRDQKFLRLDARLLKAGIQTPGGVVYDELGSPQGSIVSPVIANAFLDTVLDQWFATVVKRHCRGYCELLRYADDTLAVFELAEDAQRFMRVLPLRLSKFGLRLNPTKTDLVACGKRQAWLALKAKQRMPTFDFLGFTHFWTCGERLRESCAGTSITLGRLRTALLLLALSMPCIAWSSSGSIGAPTAQFHLGAVRALSGALSAPATGSSGPAQSRVGNG